MTIAAPPASTRRTVALLKCDLTGWTEARARLGPRADGCLRAVHDAVESALDVRGVENQPGWEGAGDGGTAYFQGEDAVERAVRSAQRAVEAVRILPERVALRAVVGVDDVPGDADLACVTPEDWCHAGHILEAVCPPSMVCITENAFETLQFAGSPLAQEFGYLGTTARDDARVFASPKLAGTEHLKGLRSIEEDVYPTAVALRRCYTSGPFRDLRLWAPPHLRDTAALDLTRVYEMPRLRRHERWPALIAGAVASATDGAPSAGSRVPSVGGEFLPLPPAPQSLPDILSAHRQWVVLGGPGSGKSTLLRFLALVASGGRAVLRSRLGVDERLVPVFTTAAELLETHLAAPARGALELLALVAARSPGLADAELRRLMEQAGRQNRLWVLIDGLDECGGEAGRARQLIETLMGEPQLVGCRWLIASRVVGYTGIHMAEAGTEFEIEPLSIPAARRLARACWAELDRRRGLEWGGAASEAERRAERLIVELQLKSGLVPFLGNPLLLSMAVRLIHQGEAPLRDRTRLFDAATKALVDAWALARQEPRAASEVRRVEYEDEGRVVLPAVALHVWEQWPTGRIPEEELLRVIAANLPGAQDTGGGVTGRPPQRAPARDFLVRLEAAGAILREGLPHEWGFIHRSFQDFLVARRLVQEGELAGRIVAPTAFSPRWREVVRFVVGELAVVHGRRREAAELVRRLFCDKSHWHASELKKNLVLAAQCLADVDLSEFDVHREVVQALEQEVRKRAAGLPELVLLETMRELRGSRVAEELATRLVADPRGLNELPSRPRMALAMLGADQAIDILLGELRSGVNVMYVPQDMGRLGRPEVIAPLRAILKKDPEKKEGGMPLGARWGAAISLGTVGDAESIPLLRSLFQDESEASIVRGAAVLALGRLHDREIIPELLKGLGESEESFPRVQAIYALAEMRERAATQAVLGVLKATPFGEGRLAALRALGEIGNSESDDVLVGILRAKDMAIEYRHAAALSLARRGVREIVPDLEQAIKDPVKESESPHPLPERMTADIACEAAGWLGGSEEIGRKLHAIVSTDTRPFGPAREAALALGRLRVGEAVPELRRVLLEHRDVRTREAAGGALWQITETEREM